MIQHFRQAKMLLRNDSLHKSLHFSKSFKVFHCSVINVLLLSSAVFLSDSLFIIAPLSSFVNNFFIFFRNLFEVFHPEAFFLYFCFDSVPAVSSATALLYYHVLHLLSTAFFIYFLIYYFSLLSMLDCLQCFLYILYTDKTNPLYFSYCIKTDFR